jgi:Protein of unknown function (DUF2281)
MTTTEKIYQLLPSLNETQLDEILTFVEFLKYKQESATQPNTRNIKTLSDLQGIAKTSDEPPTDEMVRDDKTEYLDRKYR